MRARFTRDGDIKNKLKVGLKWRINFHEKSYMYADEEFHGSLEDAKVFAAKKLMSGWQYGQRNKEDYWATFSTWKEKYRNEGRFYRAENGSTAQEDGWVGGWDEQFDKRLKLTDFDGTELNFNDKLVFNK